METIHSIFGFTNLAIGKGSLVRLIKERGKKDDLPDDHGEPDVDMQVAESKSVVTYYFSDAPFGQAWMAQAASNFIELVSNKRDVLEKDNFFAPLLNIFENTDGVFNCRAIKIQSGNLVNGKFVNTSNFKPFYLFSIVVKDSSVKDLLHEYVVFPSGNKFKIYVNTGISKDKANERLEVVDFKNYEDRFRKFQCIELNAESTKLSEQVLEVPEQDESGSNDDLDAMLRSLNQS
ncbi:MAG: hypothetical protein J6P21_03965 [Clostridia bacterium]|nr:hypothetical protein [Clostridia bacterium]